MTSKEASYRITFYAWIGIFTMLLFAYCTRQDSHIATDPGGDHISVRESITTNDTLEVFAIFSDRSDSLCIFWRNGKQVDSAPFDTLKFANGELLIIPNPDIDSVTLR